MTTEQRGAPARVAVENVGGIDRAEVEFSPGVTVLSGRNATNRTSLLRAVMAALGSDDVSLKADADRGRVELTLGGETYTRELVRRDGSLSFAGDPYASDTERADLFAFLLERNEARRAVARGGDLREVIMRPVDTAEIRSEIERLEGRRDGLDEELDRLDRLADRLPGLERRRAELERRIEETEEELDARRAELEATNASLEENRERERTLEDALEELRGTRSELEDVRHRIETERESIEALEADRADVEAELAELPESPAEGIDGVDDVADVDAEIERLREHKASVEDTASRLQSLLRFNREQLSAEGPALPAELRARADGDGDDGSITDSLVDGERITCWTCGSEVARDRIEETLSALEELRERKVAERNELASELDELTDAREAYRRRRRERERLSDRLEGIESELDRRRRSLEEHESEAEELDARLEELEARIDRLDAAADDEVLEAHREVTRLEVDLDSLRSERADVIEEIEGIESELEGRDAVAAEREAVGEELTQLRTRVERLETEAVEAFNDHMAEILDLLDYGNVERIWIERSDPTGGDGRPADTNARFDLHVVRSTDAGAAYEDRVAHLSESEREVTGLVFALAGYLVHEVHESMPVVVLDSLEALDAERIAALVEYFADYADYLLVALLPEDAAALGDEHSRVTSI